MSTEKVIINFFFHRSLSHIWAIWTHFSLYLNTYQSHIKLNILWLLDSFSLPAQCSVPPLLLVCCWPFPSLLVNWCLWADNTASLIHNSWNTTRPFFLYHVLFFSPSLSAWNYLSAWLFLLCKKMSSLRFWLWIFSNWRTLNPASSNIWILDEAKVLVFYEKQQRSDFSLDQKAFAGKQVCTLIYWKFVKMEKKIT